MVRAVETVAAVVVVFMAASSVGGGRPGLCGNAQVTTPTACMDSFGPFVPTARRRHMTTRFTVPVLLLLGSLCVLPARLAAEDGKEKKPAATRPVISEEVAPLEAIAPVAKDGHKGEAYLRKPPGKGPFPAVVLVHGGIVQRTTVELKASARGTWASRYLAAGYVVAVTTWRSRDIDPQTRESPDDDLAAVEYVRKLP